MAWGGFTVLPGAADPFGSDVIADHYLRNGCDVLITLCDVFMMDPARLKGIPTVHWLPVDCEPMGASDAEKARDSMAQIAMSRFGEAQMRARGFDPAYIPHGIDTCVFTPPPDRAAMRDAMGFPPDAFLIGLNAANKDGPRKGIMEQMIAFAGFVGRHPEARLLLHSGAHGALNLKDLADALGITEACMMPDQYSYATGVMENPVMGKWYGILDLLSNCAYGEGFGLPVIEAQACGVPVVVTGASSMTELCGSGWMVHGEPFWVGGHNSWWRRPLVSEIEDAYEAAWRAREDGSITAMGARAREFALDYDADVVLERHWVPFLDSLSPRVPRTATRTAADIEALPPLPADDRRDMLVIIPSRGRPESVRRVITAAAATATAMTDIMFGFDEDDPELEANVAACVPAGGVGAGYRVGPRKGLVAWTNEIAAELVAGYRAAFSMGDDHVPVTPGWDDALLRALAESGPGFAYPNDGVRDDIPEACAVSSEVITALGWMCEPSMEHYFTDNTWADIGRHAGCLTYLPDVVVEHVNYVSRPKSVERDQTYRDNEKRFGADQAAYYAWRSGRMTDDVAQVLLARRPGDGITLAYEIRRRDSSDISAHLERLHAEAAAYAKPVVIELGVRTGNSTAAFLKAVSENGGHLWSADVDEARVPAAWRDLDCWTFLRGDDLSPAILAALPPEADVVFIDTSHESGPTMAELEAYVPRVRPGGVVLMHDTEHVAHEVGAVAEEFCARHGLVMERVHGSGGLGIIRIPA